VTWTQNQPVVDARLYDGTNLNEIAEWLDMDPANLDGAFLPNSMVTINVVTGYVQPVPAGQFDQLFTENT
jgi:hypothetical protein